MFYECPPHSPTSPPYSSTGTVSLAYVLSLYLRTNPLVRIHILTHIHAGCVHPTDQVYILDQVVFNPPDGSQRLTDETRAFQEAATTFMTGAASERLVLQGKETRLLATKNKVMLLSNAIQHLASHMAPAAEFGTACAAFLTALDLELSDVRVVMGKMDTVRDIFAGSHMVA